MLFKNTNSNILFLGYHNNRKTIIRKNAHLYQWVKKLYKKTIRLKVNLFLDINS